MKNLKFAPLLALLFFASSLFAQVPAKVNSIAAIKAISVTGVASNASVNVLGYYTAGDGGGGTYIYNSTSVATPNNGTILQPNTGGGRWLMPSSPQLSAACFGFSTGASAATNAAALQAIVAANIPVVLLPSGTFDFNSTVTITTACELKGATATGTTFGGPVNNTTTLNYTGTGKAIVLGYVGAGQMSNEKLSDFNLIGTASADGGILCGDGTGDGAVVNLDVRNLFISGFTNATSNKGYGLAVARCYLSSFGNIKCDGNAIGFLLGAGSQRPASTSTTDSFYDLYSRSTRYGLDIQDANECKFYSPVFEGCFGPPVNIAPNGVTASYIDFFGIDTEASVLSAPGSIINLDHTGAGVTININFWGGDVTEVSGANITQVIYFGAVDTCIFHNTYFSTTSPGEVATGGSASNCVMWNRAGQVPDTNIAGNVVQANGFYSVRYILDAANFSQKTAPVGNPFNGWIDVNGGFSGAASSGHGTLSGSTTNGAILHGNGSNYDASLFNSSGSLGAGIVHGTQQFDAHGTATNNAAPSGYYGEALSAGLSRASRISLNNATVTNVTSLSLTAGDWEVSGTVFYLPAASTTITDVAGGISATSATLPSFDVEPIRFAAGFPTGYTTQGDDSSFTSATGRISLASTTTIYLVAYSDFAVSTMQVYGSIHARRAR